jgi:tellurite resistance protein TerC
MENLPLWAWGAFVLFVVAMLALDLGVFNRKVHEVKVKEALIWCAVWFALAMGFNGLVLWRLGPESGLEWFTSYLVEICLSVDNIFVFILVFTYFKVPPAYQHPVLVWGIVGAALMRATFIIAGIDLLQRFELLVVAFGLILVVAGIKMVLPKKEELNPEKNFAVRLFRKFFPVAPDFSGRKFFIRRAGGAMATPLFVVLLVIETTDVFFAIDSIPAVLAITKNSFVAFTSNIFAILGLRSLYFALRGVMGLFRFLNAGLAVILVFIGAKMIVHYWHIEIGIGVSLAVIGSTLALAVAISLFFPRRNTES